MLVYGNNGLKRMLGIIKSRVEAPKAEYDYFEVKYACNFHHL